MTVDSYIRVTFISDQSLDRKMQNTEFWLIFILIACFVDSIEAYGFVILSGYGGNYITFDKT